MEIRISFKNDVLARYANQMAVVGSGGAETALKRAMLHTGRKARTQVVRALTAQTGLPRGAIARAVRIVPGDAGTISMALRSQGGNVRLKYFKARETRAGVSAAPWNKRNIFAGTFMKAGWFKSGRVAKPNWNGQVFRRSASGKFEVVRSGVFIPTEMIQGDTAQAWRDVIERDLVPRVGHELGRMLPG